jgi:hypothetical protein
MRAVSDREGREVGTSSVFPFAPASTNSKEARQHPNDREVTQTQERPPYRGHNCRASFLRGGEHFVTADDDGKLRTFSWAVRIAVAVAVFSLGILVGAAVAAWVVPPI